MVMAGCGSSTNATSNPGAPLTPEAAGPTAGNAATGTESTKLPSVDIPVASTVNLNPLPPHFTCDGADISPPLSWSKLPPNTAEIAVVTLAFAYRHGRPFTIWAVAGLNPGTKHLAPGVLPPGAVVGRNSLGQTRYSLCPPKGASEEYLVRVYALPQKVAVTSGFDAAAFNDKLVHLATSVGELSFSYKRR
jgi:phosphatidylethanolamine-binding protein (PEBP) family uncharacterized protein